MTFQHAIDERVVEYFNHNDFLPNMAGYQIVKSVRGRRRFDEDVQLKAAVIRVRQNGGPPLVPVIKGLTGEALEALPWERRSQALGVSFKGRGGWFKPSSTDDPLYLAWVRLCEHIIATPDGRGSAHLLVKQVRKAELAGLVSPGQIGTRRITMPTLQPPKQLKAGK